MFTIINWLITFVIYATYAIVGRCQKVINWVFLSTVYSLLRGVERYLPFTNSRKDNYRKEEALPSTDYGGFRNKILTITEGFQEDQITGIRFDRVFAQGNSPWSHKDVTRALFQKEDHESARGVFSDDIWPPLKHERSIWSKFFKAALALPFTSYEMIKNGALYYGDQLTRIGTGTASLTGGADALPKTIDFHSSSQELSDAFFEDHLRSITERLVHDDSLTAFRVFCNWIIPEIYQEFEYNYWRGLSNGFLNFLLDPICRILGFLLQTHLSVIIEPPTRDTSLPVMMPTGNISRMTSRPDFCVSIDGRDIIAVEMKPAPIVIDDSLEKSGLFITQLLAEMMTRKVLHGILSDGQRAVLIKFTKEQIENAGVMDQKPTIPVFFKILKQQSEGITLRAGLLSFFYDAISSPYDEQEVEDLFTRLFDKIKMSKQEYMEKVREKRRKSLSKAQKPLEACGVPYQTACLEADPSSIPIQKGDFFSQVLTVRGRSKKHLEICLGISLPEKVLLKVYDHVKAEAAQKARDPGSFIEDYAMLCVEAYLREKQIYELLQNTGFNSCYIEQDEVCADFTFKDGTWTVGPVLLLRFIENQLTEFPVNSAKHLEMARKQLSILHGVGVIHGDISRRNVLCTWDAVYLIDFAFSTIAPEGYYENLKREDLEKLEKVFSKEI